MCYEAPQHHSFSTLALKNAMPRKSVGAVAKKTRKKKPYQRQKSVYFELDDQNRVKRRVRMLPKESKCDTRWLQKEELSKVLDDLRAEGKSLRQSTSFAEYVSNLLEVYGICLLEEHGVSLDIQPHQVEQLGLARGIESIVHTDLGMERFKIRNQNRRTVVHLHRLLKDQADRTTADQLLSTTAEMLSNSARRFALTMGVADAICAEQAQLDSLTTTATTTTANVEKS